MWWWWDEPAKDLGQGKFDGELRLFVSEGQKQRLIALANS